MNLLDCSENDIEIMHLVYIKMLAHAINSCIINVCTTHIITNQRWLPENGNRIIILGEDINKFGL
jgi:hypothetical protein